MSSRPCLTDRFGLVWPTVSEADGGLTVDECHKSIVSAGESSSYDAER